MDEKEAIQRIKQRDWRGMEALIERYQLRAVRAAYLVVGDPAEAEDIVADAFIRVWEKIDQFDARRPFAPWFFTLVFNAARRMASRSARWAGLSDLAQGEESALPESLPGVEETIIQAENEAEVRRALARLPLNQRIAVVQRYYLDWSEARMAEAANQPGGTIKWRLHQARARLRDWLRQPPDKTPLEVDENR